eukprot:Nk52_evm2s2241 gene=Nk52_evmTU2s2241
MGCFKRCGYCLTVGWLTAFNFVCFLFGCALVGGAIFVFVSSFKDEAEVLAEDYNYDMNYIDQVVISLAVLGGFMCLFGIFGCCGSIGKSKRFLKLYIVIVILTFVALGICAAFTARGKTETDDWMTDELSPILESYFSQFKDAVDQGADISQIDGSSYLQPISEIQTTIGCCGVNGIEDYTNNGLPLNWTEGCDQYTTGCVEKTSDYMDTAFWYAIYALIAFGCILVLNILLAMLYIHHIRKKQREKMQREQSKYQPKEMSYNDDTGSIHTIEIAYSGYS